MSSSLTVTGRVSGITCRVIESEASDRQAITSSHIEAMSGPVLDIEILDNSIDHLVQGNEVVRLVSSTVRSFSIPIRLSITVDHSSLGASDRDVGTSDFDRVEIRVFSVTKGSLTCKGDAGSILKTCEVNHRGSWSTDVLENNVCAGRNNGGDLGILSRRARRCGRSDGLKSCQYLHLVLEFLTSCGWGLCVLGGARYQAVILHYRRLTTVAAATDATEVAAGAANEAAEETALETAIFEEAFVEVEVALGVDEDVETIS